MYFKFIVILVLFLTLHNVVCAQSGYGRKFIYDVQEDVYGANEMGTNIKVARINYEATIFHLDSEYILITKPKYMDKYPNGVIPIYQTKDKSSDLLLCLDSIQIVTYLNLSSQEIKQHLPVGQRGGYNYLSYVKSPYHQVYFPQQDTANIEGLSCRKYIIYAKGTKDITHVLWINEEIKMDLNPVTVFSPGMVVEASVMSNTNKKFTLIGYDLNCQIPAGVFEPEVFEKPFKIMK